MSKQGNVTVKSHKNICPKADRCKFGEECINYDTFRGEYLCFRAKTMSQYSRPKKGENNESANKK